MVACSGYLHAFNDTGLLDCALYMAGKQKKNKKEFKANRFHPRRLWIYLGHVSVL